MLACSSWLLVSNDGASTGPWRETFVVLPLHDVSRMCGEEGMVILSQMSDNSELDVKLLSDSGSLCTHSKTESNVVRL